MVGLSRRALLMGAPLLIAAGRQVPAARPLSRMDLAWWRNRHEAVLRRLRQGPVDLLLIGDSITQDLERRADSPHMNYGAVWNRFYAPRNAVNLGFNGDTTASVIWRLRNGEVSGIAPKVAQLLIGANNFGRVHWDAADTFAGIEAILAELRQRLPRTKVILLSVLPSRRSGWIDAQTLAVNRMLAARFKAGGEVKYIDVTALFMKDGSVDDSAYYDGSLYPLTPSLHPTAQAWMRMAERVEPDLAALMDHRAR